MIKVLKKTKALFLDSFPRCGYLHPRIKIANKYIKGTGLEIGALHAPLLVSKFAQVKYVDIVSREISVSKFPELDPKKIVEVDYITDGFTLRGIKKNSFDFLIANHVLEHTPNPIQVLENWLSVLKVGGVVFFVLPNLNHTFDRGRSLTTIDHLVDDYRFYQNLGDNELGDHNLKHYLEWVRISDYNILKKKRTENEIGNHAKKLNAENSEIHFHTFNKGSITKLLNYVEKNMFKPFFLQEIIDGRGGEIITVIQKK